MELSERYIQTLENEGFSSVYEHQDEAGKVYPEHTHKGKVAVCLTDGSASLEIDGVKKEITAPKRVDIPPNTPHSLVVGPNGWIVIIGEEIEGDS